MAKRHKIEIDDRDLQRQIKRALKESPRQTVRAVMDCALHLAAESAERAPIESGDLRNNCHADLNGLAIFAERQKLGLTPPPSTNASAEVGYSLPYAVRQHEELSYRHDRDDGYRVPYTNARTGNPNKTGGLTVNLVPGGEAKYLEKPFEENKGRYLNRFERIVGDTLK